MKSVIYSVRLDDDTIGEIDSASIDFQSAENFIGEIMRVSLHDENGMPIEVEGRLAEVLEESEGH